MKVQGCLEEIRALGTKGEQNSIHSSVLNMDNAQAQEFCEDVPDALTVWHGRWIVIMFEERCLITFELVPAN